MMTGFILAGLLMAGVVQAQQCEAHKNELLLRAIREGKADVVARLIAEGADVNAGGRRGGAALYLAAEGGHPEVVHTLLDHGADPNRIPWPDPAAGVIGMTPLMAAAANGHAAVAELLLARGADASIQAGETALYEQGVTALYLATVKGHDEVIGVLERALTSGESLWKYMVLAIWSALGLIIAALPDEAGD